MRAMTAEEFYHFGGHVKCPWLDCSGGLGLAGHGACSFGGDWDNPDCPEYITEEDFINYFKKGGKAMECSEGHDLTDDGYLEENGCPWCKNKELERKIEDYREALIWCGGSKDFEESGIARKGWESICIPLILKKGSV